MINTVAKSYQVNRLIKTALLTMCGENGDTQGCSPLPWYSMNCPGLTTAWPYKSGQIIHNMEGIMAAVLTDPTG